MDIRNYVDTLRARVKSCPASLDKIAKETDGQPSYSWIAKFSAGKMLNPRIETLSALDVVLQKIEQDYQASIKREAA